MHVVRGVLEYRKLFRCWFGDIRKEVFYGNGSSRCMRSVKTALLQIARSTALSYSSSYMTVGCEWFTYFISHTNMAYTSACIEIFASTWKRLAWNPWNEGTPYITRKIFAVKNFSYLSKGISIRILNTRKKFYIRIS